MVPNHFFPFCVFFSQYWENGKIILTENVLEEKRAERNFMEWEAYNLPFFTMNEHQQKKMLWKKYNNENVKKIKLVF